MITIARRNAEYDKHRRCLGRFDKIGTRNKRITGNQKKKKKNKTLKSQKGKSAIEKVFPLCVPANRNM